MKRSAFLQSLLALLAVPFVRRAKAEPSEFAYAEVVSYDKHGNEICRERMSPEPICVWSSWEEIANGSEPVKAQMTYSWKPSRNMTDEESATLNAFTWEQLNS